MSTPIGIEPLGASGRMLLSSTLAFGGAEVSMSFEADVELAV